MEWGGRKGCSKCPMDHPAQAFMCLMNRANCTHLTSEPPTFSLEDHTGAKWQEQVLNPCYLTSESLYYLPE